MAVIDDFKKGTIFKLTRNTGVVHKGSPRILTGGAIIQQVTPAYGTEALFEVLSGSFVQGQGKKFPSAEDAQVALPLEDPETLQGLQKVR